MGRKLPLSEAAIRLHRDYQQVRRLVMRGTLAGGRDEFGRLYVEEESLLTRLADSANAGEPTLRAGENQK